MIDLSHRHLTLSSAIQRCCRLFLCQRKHGAKSVPVLNCLPGTRSAPFCLNLKQDPNTLLTHRGWHEMLCLPVNLPRGSTELFLHRLNLKNLHQSLIERRNIPLLGFSFEYSSDVGITKESHQKQSQKNISIPTYLLNSIHIQYL